MTALLCESQPAHKAVSGLITAIFIVSAFGPGASVPAFVINSEAVQPVPYQFANPSTLPPARSMVVFTQLDLYANIETVGVVVSGADLPKTAELTYRQNGEATWHTGHPLMRIDDGRLVGSLFGLSAATTYEVRVLDGTTEISGATTTQSNELQFTPSAILHVDDSAPTSGDGSAAAPFQTIQEGVNHATPGTQVLVADGVYHEAVSFPASGTEGNWIQIKAEGSAAVLDGSETLSRNVWQPHDRARVWVTKIAGPITYLRVGPIESRLRCLSKPITNGQKPVTLLGATFPSLNVNNLGLIEGALTLADAS